jgi:hypothetical protein
MSTPRGWTLIGRLRVAFAVQALYRDLHIINTGMGSCIYPEVWVFVFQHAPRYRTAINIYHQKILYRSLMVYYGPTVASWQMGRAPKRQRRCKKLKLHV